LVIDTLDAIIEDRAMTSRLLLAGTFVLGLLVSASAETTVSCNGYYPEPESPDHTIITADVAINFDTGRVTGMTCNVQAGDVGDCPVLNGTCCPCNVIRGDVPECRVSLLFTESSAEGSCYQKYDPSHYGNDTAVTEESQAAVVKITGPKPKKRRGGSNR